jgi:hypothetical protein
VQDLQARQRLSLPPRHLQPFRHGVGCLLRLLLVKLEKEKLVACAANPHALNL